MTRNLWLATLDCRIHRIGWLQSHFSVSLVLTKLCLFLWYTSRPFCRAWYKPHPLAPRAFSSFKMEDRRNPWPRLLKYSKNRGVFCHVAHDEMVFSEVVSSVWRPCLFSAIGNRWSNETKTIRCVYVTKFQRIFGAILAALARGPFWTRRGSGYEVAFKPCLRTFALFVSVHPYHARNSLRDVMPRHALSARTVEEMWRYIAPVGILISMHGLTPLNVRWPHIFFW